MLYNNSCAEVALRLPATGNELDILDGENRFKAMNTCQFSSALDHCQLI